MSAREQIQALQARMRQSIIGQETVVERLVIGLLANGNLLVEGLPGLAKTRAIKALAKNVEASFSRIQFTPDLLPSDVTGTEVYHQVNGKGEFRFDPGPIFANIVLADEITGSRMSPVNAAEIAARNGVEIFTIGVGDPGAAGEGRLDLAALEDIAGRAGGRFFVADDAVGLAAVYDRIDETAPRQVETLSFRPRQPLGHWPLAAAAILALLAVGWLHLRSRRRAAA